MPAHPTRARRRRDIRRDAERLEALMPLRHGLPERNSLGAGPYGIRCVLDIRSVDKLAVVCEDRGADAESRVWAVGCGFGGLAA